VQRDRALPFPGVEAALKNDAVRIDRIRFVEELQGSLLALDDVTDGPPLLDEEHLTAVGALGLLPTWRALSGDDSDSIEDAA
jgi:hypothetical protein